VGGGWRGNGAKRNDLASRNPGATEGSGAYTVLLYEVKTATQAARHGRRAGFLFFLFYNHFFVIIMIYIFYHYYFHKYNA
jgi:hypothetical protein